MQEAGSALWCIPDLVPGPEAGWIVPDPGGKSRGEGNRG